MGLGVERVWLDTFTFFGPGFPDRSGRHLILDIAKFLLPWRVDARRTETPNAPQPLERR